MRDHAGLRSVLPHRHPILLVDRVLRCEPGHEIEAVKAVTGSEPCYAGLAEDAPAAAFRYPEALLLESFAQSAGVLWCATLGREFRGTLVLAELRGIRFHQPVLPGEVIRHVATVGSASGAIAVVSGRSSGSSGGLALTVDRLVLAARR